MDPIYEIWQANRGIKGSDLSDGFRWPLDNLALAMKRLLLPSFGVFRGGKVKQTGVASKNVIVEPLGGLSPSGEMLILDTETTLAAPDNASIFSRVDLVSIHVVTTDAAPVSRAFWNPGTQTAFSQNAVASRTLKGTPVYTAGVASGSPTAPPLPTGHVALATVTVGPGFTNITDANISRSVAPDPLQLLTFPGPGGLPAMPYTLDSPTLRLSVRDGGAALIFASVTIQAVGSFDPAVALKAAMVSIEAVTGPTLVGRASCQLHQGGRQSVTVWGVVTGPTSARDYQLTFSIDGSSGGVGGYGIQLLAEQPAGTPTINVFGAISL